MKGIAIQIFGLWFAIFAAAFYVTDGGGSSIVVLDFVVSIILILFGFIVTFFEEK